MLNPVRRSARGGERTAWRSRLVLCLMLLTALVGCAGPPRTDGGPSAADAYQRGAYEQALTRARVEAERTSGVRRDEANYLAGLSAYRLGRGAEAIDRLERATRSRDATLAAQAHATLGLIHAGRRNDGAARRHLETAVEDLRGPDRAQVHYHLGRIDQRAGRWAAARSHLSIALSLTDDADLRRVIRQQMGAEGFTLQFGAYSQREHAERRANELRPLARRLRTDYPKVIPGATESGGTLYLVQMGSFTTEALARRAAERSGDQDVYIVPAQ